MTDAHPLDRSTRLGDRTWPTVGGGVLLVPLGSTEQHGPHLPLRTDTMIAEAVALELGERLRATGTDATVAPALPYGASGEHEGFAGTLSIGTRAVAQVLVELGRSAGLWCERVVFVNAHGGNVDALREAVPVLRGESRDAAWLPCGVPSALEPDLHAGWAETSLWAALEPGAVRESRLEAGDVRSAAELLPLLRSRGVHEVAPNGVLGDPRAASATRGAELFAAIGDQAWELLSRGAPGADGALRLHAPLSRSDAATGAS